MIDDNKKKKEKDKKIPYDKHELHELGIYIETDESEEQKDEN